MPPLNVMVLPANELVAPLKMMLPPLKVCSVRPPAMFPEEQEAIEGAEVVEAEEEDDFFLDVDVLQNHGINAADIKKLKTAGICTLKGIQMATKKKAVRHQGYPARAAYTGGKVIFIDTENTFRPDRLRPIADRFNLDQSAMLDNVLYARAYTSEHQYELMDMVAAKLHEEAGVFKLLIVDSIMALFRVDFSGRGELADRQQKLAQMLSRLQKISEEYNVAVFLTNQMTADPGAALSFQADPKKPVGGHILAHASTTRISLRKGRGEVRIAKIYDSPDLPESEASFAITSGGVTDAKE
ncbi:Meiotic recombination protein DMC1/LIM15 [Amphibalanus amphitrite]|uniref:Meiotic recombination protein DMC1/LIM15 n=1 Tax=Amphibalanus amphitrite TaxID=1232801 RepID=A0A6A4W3Y1_AMPAM|nr:Meiotic recombination protein DMC1/LIM15 [Amphibalanus amphitrite]